MTSDYDFISGTEPTARTKKAAVKQTAAFA